MSKRFIIMSLAWACLMLYTFANFTTRDPSLMDVFYGLFSMLILGGIALWPTSGRDQRVELKLERAGWADRIDFEPTGGRDTRD